MVIILEGCDCTGKTTLAKKLCEKYKLMYNHVTSKDPNNYEYYLTTMKIDNTLWDRHLLGEMIYPTVYNRKGNLDLDLLTDLINKANENKVVILVLTEDDEEIIRRINAERPLEDNQTRKNIHFINSTFVKLAKKFNLPLIKTSKLSFEDICEVIENVSY